MTKRKALRTAFTVIVTLVLFVLLWEGYKWMGQQTEDHWPGTQFGLPVSTDDLTMPHASDIFNELTDEIRAGRETLPMTVYLAKKAAFTFLEAAIGFSLGVIVGLLLAIFMLRWRFAERGFLPWINVSQTVPVIALAPIVVTWARLQGYPDMVGISLIATYLTFFPVAVSGLRGLQSPDSSDVELMRSYAASWSSTLIKLRLPAARPFLFPAFKLAATLSVVGSIVGEISIGTKTGLGRAILDFAQRYAVWPERLYSSVIAASLLGLFVFGLVNAAEWLVIKRGREVLK